MGDPAARNPVSGSPGQASRADLLSGAPEGQTRPTPGVGQAWRVALEITALGEDVAGIVGLPWGTPLLQWPEDPSLAGRRGISRHVVRLISAGDDIYAVKETVPEFAHREYRLLRELARLGAPAVEPVAVVDGRPDVEDEALPAAIVSRYLPFSLPYRILLTHGVRNEDVEMMANALALLLVRLHLVGFWWGDCSLSNTLFRRDADGFSAYLVDAETGEIHPSLSNGQREHDLEIARFNVAAELEDLTLSGEMSIQLDPVRASEAVIRRYRRLWSTLKEPQALDPHDEHAVEKAMRNLHDLGFDVEEVAVQVEGENRLTFLPKIVAAGHHANRLERLTGLHTEELQAKRLLAAFDRYRAREPQPRDPEAVSAKRWMEEVFLPVIELVPPELAERLEPAQIFHEILEHRWYLGERAGHDVGLIAAAEEYIEKVLPYRPTAAEVSGLEEDAPLVL